jgi:hypothetical protein
LTKKIGMESTNAGCKEAKTEEKEARRKAKADRAAVKAAKAAMKESRALVQAASAAREEACFADSDATGAAAYPAMVEDPTGKYCPIIYLDEPGHMWDLAPSCDDGIFMEGALYAGEAPFHLPSVPDTLEGFQECIKNAKKEPGCKKAAIVMVDTCLAFPPNRGGQRTCRCMEAKTVESFQSWNKAKFGANRQEITQDLRQPPHQLFNNNMRYVASCALMSKSQWRKETKKAINFAPTVRTLATDCEQGYSRTQVDQRTRPYTLLHQTMASSWEDCLTKVKGAPQCSQAMAVTFTDNIEGNSQSISLCECYRWYRGAMIEAGYRTCVFMDKFVADSPVFSKFISETYMNGNHCARGNCQKTERAQEVFFGR